MIRIDQFRRRSAAMHVRVRVAVGILSLFAALFVACHPVTPVTFDNETNEQLEFYTQSDVQTALLGSVYVHADSSLEYDLIEADYTWLRVAATREDGEWVFDHLYERAELESAEKTVVVSSLEPIAPPSDVPVAPPIQATPPVAPAVTFDNETRQNLEFYTMTDTSGVLAGVIGVSPESSWETPDPRFGYGTITGSFAWMRVAATAEDGQWVFDHTYTWDEFVEAKRRVIVSSLEPVAPPANVKVVPLEGGAPPVLPTPKTESAPAPASSKSKGTRAVP